MKKLLFFTALLASLATAPAQITNGVVGSTITAVTTVNGTDKTFIIQSGATRTVTIDYFTSGLTAKFNSATNNLWTALTNTAYNASNQIGAAYLSNSNQDYANFLSAHNLAAAAAPATTVTAVTNSLANLWSFSTTASNTALSNLQATNAAIMGSIVALSLSSTNNATNGGAVSFAQASVTDLRTPNTTRKVAPYYYIDNSTAYGSNNANTSFLYPLDMRAALQTIVLAPRAANQQFAFYPTNAADGQTVNILVMGNSISCLAGIVTNFTAGYSISATMTAAAMWNSIGSAAYAYNVAAIYAPRVAAIQLQVYGTNIIYSGSTFPLY